MPTPLLRTTRPARYTRSQVGCALLVVLAGALAAASCADDDDDPPAPDVRETVVVDTAESGATYGVVPMNPPTTATTASTVATTTATG